MNKSELKQLIKEEISNMGGSKSSKVNFSFNQGEIELLVDALEYYKDEAPDEWSDAPQSQRVLSNLKSKSNYWSSELDEELETPNEMGDKAVEDESNGPGY